MIQLSLLFNRRDFYVVFCLYLSYRYNFIVMPLLLFTFISTLKIILSMTGGHFVINSLLLSKHVTVTKCPLFTRTNLFKRNISLSTVDDKYSFTRARNALVSLITPMESLEPPSYWYSISYTGIGSLCDFFRLEECVFLSIMRTCGLIRQNIINGKTSIYVEKDDQNAFLSQYEVCDVEISTSKFSVVIDNKDTRKNMTYIRIGTKSSSSYLKATTQYNHHIPPPMIKIRQLSHAFLKSISVIFQRQ